MCNSSHSLRPRDVEAKLKRGGEPEWVVAIVTSFILELLVYPAAYAVLTGTVAET